jgi:hypothetical protein
MRFESVTIAADENARTSTERRAAITPRRRIVTSDEQARCKAAPVARGLARPFGAKIKAMPLGSSPDKRAAPREHEVG